MAKDKKYVKFFVSPTGRFGLGYNAGEVAHLDTDQAAELVDAAYAQYTDKDGNPVDTAASGKKEKDVAGDLKAITAKAVGFGIDVPATASFDDVQNLIDQSHTKALAELKTVRETTVKTNDPEKEAAAAGVKEVKAETATDKGAANAEKS